MKFVNFDKQDGRILGFYDPQINGDNIPEGCIVISDEVWMFYLEHQGQYVVDITKEYDSEISVVEDIFIKPVVDPELLLSEARASKIVSLDMECQATIEKGFYSSALGEEHFYRFNKEEDQLNFNQVATMIQFFPEQYAEILWKTEDAGVLLHTQEQFKQVLADAALNKNSSIQKYWGLKAQVIAAASIEEVQAITW